MAAEITMKNGNKRKRSSRNLGGKYRKFTFGGTI